MRPKASQLNPTADRPVVGKVETIALRAIRGRRSHLRYRCTRVRADHLRTRFGHAGRVAVGPIAHAEPAHAGRRQRSRSVHLNGRSARPRRARCADRSPEHGRSGPRSTPPWVRGRKRRAGHRQRGSARRRSCARQAAPPVCAATRRRSTQLRVGIKRCNPAAASVCSSGRSSTANQRHSTISTDAGFAESGSTPAAGRAG
jgi:hypothetical protein